MTRKNLAGNPAKNIPTHIGFIVDGNRRWARAKHLPTKIGHKTGYEVLKKMAYVARDRGVKFVSAYIFSTENWQRSKEEVNYLMDLFLEAFSRDLHQMIRDGFRVIFLGRKNGVRAKILEAIEKTERESANNSGTTLALCFNYGGHAEIVDAARKLSESSMEFTEENFAKNLYQPELPPIDMLVRSSGEQRLSGFMLWRAAYAELMWIEKNWPDMAESDMDDILAEYARRSRRFGK